MKYSNAKVPLVLLCMMAVPFVRGESGPNGDDHIVSMSSHWELGGQILVIGDKPGQEIVRVSALFSLPDERIVIANYDHAPAISIYTKNGRLSRRFGREGEGPGEFSAIQRVFHAAPDTIIAYDAGNLRTTYLDTTGAVLKTIQLQVQDLGNGDIRTRLAGRFGDDTYMLRPFSYYPARVRGPARGTWEIPFVRSAPDGQVINRVPGFLEGEWIAQAGGPTTAPVFGRRATWLAVDSGFYYGYPSSFQVGFYSARGEKIRNFYRDTISPRITDEVFQRHVAARLSDAPDEQHSSALRILSNRRRDGRLPYFGDKFVVDRAGYLWVAPYRYPGVDGESWTVFDRTGAFEGEVVLPLELEPWEIGEDYVLGVWTDEFDVETVHLYKLHRN